MESSPQNLKAPGSQDMKALTAGKERNSQNHSQLADTLNKDLKTFEQQNRRIESQIIVGIGNKEAKEPESQNLKQNQRQAR